jgi:hypothetical protein
MSTHIGYGDRGNHCGQQVDKHDETHREAAEATKLIKEDQLCKIVHR